MQLMLNNYKKHDYWEDNMYRKDGSVRNSERHSDKFFITIYNVFPYTTETNILG